MQSTDKPLDAREPSSDSGKSAPWRRSDDDLRAMWLWVRCDFEKFLAILQWLDTLPTDRQAEQYASAQRLKRHDLAAMRSRVLPKDEAKGSQACQDSGLSEDMLRRGYKP